MGIRRAALIVTTVVACFALTGCTTPTPEPVLPVQLAFGEFQDATGAASGHIAINRMADDSVVAVMTDVTIPGTDLLLIMADRWVGPEENCFESGWPLVGPPYDPGVEDIYILQPIFDSPEELAAFVVGHETGAETGCLVEIDAFANLYWDPAG
jgi:hypothetical protein